MNTPYFPIICAQYGFDDSLIRALIAVESNGNPLAIRYEPRYVWLYKPEDMATRYRVPVETERMQQKTSWGVLQIMGAVARERGCRQRYLSVLCQPEMGLRFGVKHLAWLRDVKEYNDTDLISAYNQGSPRRNRRGQYINQGYVSKVLNAMGRFC